MSSSELGKYSFGIGDRFGQQGVYQLQAFFDARESGIEVTPVWNKSYREHKIVGSEPASTRGEANQAVKQTRWEGAYFVDADHIRMDTVEPFLPFSDFFTIDVADYIGQFESMDEVEIIAGNYRERFRDAPVLKEIDSANPPNEEITEIVKKYYAACREASQIYSKISKGKADTHVAIEVSMDEVMEPQSPLEILFILKFLSDFQVPLDTLAPKFPGHFNKGVDFDGDVKVFEKVFSQQIRVIQYAAASFGPFRDLKLSIHTGSDKFSLYPGINRIINEFDSGLHLKTAGTTWLEEIAGLAASGMAGLDFTKQIYREAHDRFEELTKPYKEVLSIDQGLLPAPEVLEKWDSQQVTDSIRHNEINPFYNPHLRQLMHVAYKIAAEKGPLFLELVRKNHEIIGANVKQNICEKHLIPLFKQDHEP